MTEKGLTLISGAIVIFHTFYYILFLYNLEKRDLAYDLISTEQDTDVLQITDDNDVENNICNAEIITGIYYFCYLLVYCDKIIFL